VTATIREREERGSGDRYLTSSSRDAFGRYRDDEYAGVKGRRVMKTMDGVELPPGCRDAAFLADNGLSKPRASMTDDEVQAALPAGGVAEAPAITLYSQRAAEGVFPMTTASGRNPHARTAKFSAPLGEAVPEHDGGMDHSRQRRTERRAGLLRQGAGSELSVREAMRSIRARLAEQFGPTGVLRVQASFASMDRSGDGSLSQEELATGLRRLGLPMPGRELAQLFSWFDADRSGAVSATELVDALRGTAAPVGAGLGDTRAGAAAAASMSASALGVGAGEASAGAWGLDTIRVTRTAGATSKAGGRAAARARLVEAAWEAVAGDGAASMPLDDVMASFRPAGYPPVAAGRMAPAAGRSEVARAMDIEGRAASGSGAGDGVATWVEFSGLHRSLSSCMEDDAAFAAAVRGMWGLPDTGAAAAAAAALSGGGDTDSLTRLVEVTHHDGSVEAVGIVDRIGLTPSDEPAIRARLRRDGVTHVHSVRLLD